MILRSLEVENFLKFRRVRLTGLPARGLVGIRGPNEAGKTSLGEAIAFALFGRTLKLSAEERPEAIRWGARAARVSVCLELDGGPPVEVHREMDRSGGYSARLLALGEDGPHELAHGPMAVDEALERRLGIDFEAFRYAFYLGQKEVELILSGAGTGGVLERMVGIEALEEARARAREEREDLEGKARELSMWLRLQRELYGRVEREDAERRSMVEEAEAAGVEVERLEARLEELSVQIRACGERDVVGTHLRDLQERIEAAALAKSLSGRVAFLEELGEADLTGVEETSRAVDEARELRQEYQLFSESLEELEAYLRARARELVGAGEGEPAAGERAPDPDAPRSRRQRIEGRIEVLRKRREEDREAAEGLEGRARAVYRGAGVVGLLGLGATLATGNLAGLMGLLAPLVAFLPGRAMGAHRENLEARVQESGSELEELEQELARVGHKGSLCDRLAVRDRGALVEGVRELGEEAPRKLLERIERRHPRFFGAPEAFREGYGKVLDESVAHRRKAYQAALEASRRTAGDAQACRRRLEGLMRSPAVPRVAGTALEDLDPERTRAGVERDLDRLERLAVRLEGRSEGLPGERLSRDGIASLFHAVDPERSRSWGDLEGIYRLLDGVEPPGVGRKEDPLPWARRQAEKLEALLPGGSEATDALEEERAALRAERERARARHELLARRVGELGQLENEEDPRAVIVDLERDLAALRHEAEVREVLADLLDATAERVRGRLFPAIARYASRLLPQITGGRHGTVELGDDGELRIFAPEAGRPVPLVALSGGARDQFLLALRLSFAAAVMRSRAAPGACHFLFLDEPLASSDETRGAAFMKLLEQRSEAFGQVFVVTHRPAGEDCYDLVLRLEADGDELELDHGEETAVPRAV